MKFTRRDWLILAAYLLSLAVWFVVGSIVLADEPQTCTTDLECEQMHGGSV